jgi:hypothetical protein
VRLLDERLGAEKDAPVAKAVQVKGLFPVSRKARIGFVSSVFDNTSGELQPVISALDNFQERHTLAFQHATEVGAVEPGSGLVGWVKVGIVLPQILQTPRGGTRSLALVCRIVDLDNPPDITNGFHQPDHPGLLWQRLLTFQYKVEGRGYLEMVELRDEARAISVQVALAVAMWEGSLHDQEGRTIKCWIEKILSSTPSERKEQLKISLNNATKDGYSSAKKGRLSLSDLMRRLNEIGDHACKYEAVELCFDVMTIGGAVNSDRARLIDLVAKSLDLDMSEFEKIRDAKLLQITPNSANDIEVEHLLGIEAHWDVAQVRRHLRAEFQKWNNRITTLPEGHEREGAQRMIEAISEARRRYG